MCSFDNLDHDWLMTMLAERIADKALLRLIKQWLKAPVIERGEDGKRRVYGSRRGTPQGGVMTPRTQKATFPGRVF